MTICTATYKDPHAPITGDALMPAMPCFKRVDEDGRHRGDHQTLWPVRGKDPKPDAQLAHERQGYPGYVRLVEWSDHGGSSSHSYDPSVPYDNCSCRTGNLRLGHEPGDHHWTRCTGCDSIMDTPKSGPVLCTTCSLWTQRVADAQSGKWRYLRPHGQTYVYSFSPSNRGGFGGRRFTVTMDDGTVIAKDQAGLWAAGEIPWWRLDDLPENCTIESGSGSDKVPGHTDRGGRPLPFYGAPTPGGA